MKSTKVFMIALTVLLGTYLGAEASLIQVGSRPALNPDDEINWGDYVTFFPNILFPIPYNGVTQGADPFTLSTDDPDFVEVRDQGGSYFGNYDPGDALILADAASVAGAYFRIDFVNPVAGVATEIETVNQTGLWDVSLELFDSANTSLGSLSFTDDFPSGPSFVGLLSDSVDVASVEVRSSNWRDGAIFADLVINHVSITHTPGTATAVLDSGSTVVLLGCGLLGLASLRRITDPA